MNARSPKRGASALVIDIATEAEAWRALPQRNAVIRRAITAALAANDAAFGEVSVALVDDAAIRALNAAYRGKDSATNVLSFPAPPPPPGAPVLRGDIVVAYETTAREAAAEGKAISDHLVHLVVHGTLHLVGHDHETDAEASVMEAMERAILAGIGIADPYAERVAD